MSILRVPEQEFEKAYKSHPHLKLKLRVTRFNAAMDVFIAENGAHEFIAIRPEWKTVDRIIACRLSDSSLVLCFYVLNLIDLVVTIMFFFFFFSFVIIYSCVYISFSIFCVEKCDT